VIRRRLYSHPGGIRLPSVPVGASTLTPTAFVSRLFMSAPLFSHLRHSARSRLFLSAPLFSSLRHSAPVCSCRRLYSHPYGIRLPSVHVGVSILTPTAFGSRLFLSAPLLSHLRHSARSRLFLSAPLFSHLRHSAPVRSCRRLYSHPYGIRLPSVPVGASTLTPMAFGSRLFLSVPLFSSIRHSAPVCSCRRLYSHTYGILTLTLTCLKHSLGQGECACKFGPDRLSRLADYKKYTRTRTNSHNGKSYTRLRPIPLGE